MSDKIVSLNGRFVLEIQNDGNPVVHDTRDGSVIWDGQSGKWRTPNPMPVPGPDPLPPGPAPIPPPSPPFDPMPALQLYLAGLTYSWPVALQQGTLDAELDTLVSLRRDAGLASGQMGLGVELAGSTWWDALPDWQEDLTAKVTQFITAVPMLRARGIPLALYYLNANFKGTNELAWWNQYPPATRLAHLIAQAQRIADAVGFEGMVISACNENDSSTPVLIREGLRLWFAQHGDPAMLMSVTPTLHGERYVDTHPASIYTSAPCDDTHLLTTDNGPIIRELYGAVEGVTVNVEAHRTWISSYGRRGKLVFYNLARTPHIQSQRAAWAEVLRHYHEVLSAPPGTALADDLDLARVPTIIVRHTPFTGDALRAAPITASILRATTDGSRLLTAFTPYPFPDHAGVDAVCYFFYERSSIVVGGKFDAWRTGGQVSKSLVNVVDGYGGHVMPVRGTPCWTMISSMDGTQRSNSCRVTWT
jgi:hypothetical protein